MDITKLSTPCFILDEQDIVENITEFQEALSGFFSKNIVGYSVKTNSLPYVLEIARKQGCYAEVVSFHEYKLAVKVGFPKEHIIYNGPMKSKETFLDAIQHRAIVNIETWREIEWLEELPFIGQTYEVGIRLNIDISTISPEDEDHPNDDSRFGFSYESGEFKVALHRLSILQYVEVVGVHSHREPKTRSVRFYRRVVEYVQEIILSCNFKLKYWDLGGVFFGRMPNKPTYAEYVKNIFSVLSPKLRDTMFIVEPGNAIVASGFHYLMKVIDVKQHNENIYVSTDGSRNDVDPFFHKSDYFKEFIYENQNGNPSRYPQIVGGFTCLEYDRLFSLPVGERELNVGDYIIFHRVGAYTMSLTPLFIHYFPIVYLNTSQGNLCVIREEWTEEDFIRKSKF